MSRDPIAQFSGDGTLLATRTRSWEAIVWDPRSGQKLYPLPGPQPQMHCFCFSADKSLLAIGSGSQNVVRLWELPAIDETTEKTIGGGENATALTTPVREDAPATPETEAAPRPSKTTDTAPKKAIRTWTSADGKFTVQAQFVKAIAGKVYLRLQNGRTIQVPMERLSEDDRRFLQQ
jgi:WD40 repeat protein